MSSNPFDSELRYDKMVENALRDVVRQAIQCVIDNGLPADHHFYITFLTEYEGVEIPDYLKQQYPDEMTIVLQYQFYGLEIKDRCIHVTLSFNNVPEKLVVPLDSITIFADPAVNFALQFQPMDEFDEDEIEFYPEEDDESGDEKIGESSDDDKGKGQKGKKGKGDKDDGANVVSLDTFRKK